MTGAACILEKFVMCKMQESMTQENLGAKSSARIQRDSGLKTRSHTSKWSAQKYLYRPVFCLKSDGLMVAICWWDPVEVKHVFTQNKSPGRQPTAHEITGLQNLQHDSWLSELEGTWVCLLWWKVPVASRSGGQYFWKGLWGLGKWRPFKKRGLNSITLCFLCEFRTCPEFDSDKKAWAYNLFTFPWLLRDIRCLCWKGNLTALREKHLSEHTKHCRPQVCAGDALWRVTNVFMWNLTRESLLPHICTK